MGRADKERLTLILGQHLNTINETFQILDQTAVSSLEKVSWNEVVQMGEQLSKQATQVGMLWTGKVPVVKELEDNMAAYFNTLQGFLLISHGSSVGAGPTLFSCIHTSVKQVVDSSFMLMKECVSSYGTGKTENLTLPQLVGTVWNACSALKKAPSSNVTAIGRALTQVRVSLKDVLREMKELKPASSDPVDEVSEETESKTGGSDDSCSEEMGNDLSPEEMKIAQLATTAVSDTVAVVNELIRAIMSLLKQENKDGHDNFVDTLEKLLKSCQEIGAHIDEIGACLYPPQEIPVIEATLNKISNLVEEIQVELQNLKGTTGDFLQACISLRNSLKLLDSELHCPDGTDLVPKLENLNVTS